MRIDTRKLRQQIVAWRDIIRWHRDQVGDDRCWLDDWRVYEVVLEEIKPQWPGVENCLILCHQYHTDRSSPLPPRCRRGEVKKELDEDLRPLNHMELLVVMAHLYAVVNIHYKIGDGQRTKEDDLRLYAVLPDGILPDQRLPVWEVFQLGCEEFISTPDREQRLHEW